MAWKHKRPKGTTRADTPSSNMKAVNAICKHRAARKHQRVKTAVKNQFHQMNPQFQCAADRGMIRAWPETVSQPLRGNLRWCLLMIFEACFALKTNTWKKRWKTIQRHGFIRCLASAMTRRLLCKTFVKTYCGRGRCDQEAFAPTCLNNWKHEDVKTKHSCETSFRDESGYPSFSPGIFFKGHLAISYLYSTLPFSTVPFSTLLFRTLLYSWRSWSPSLLYSSLRCFWPILLWVSKILASCFS